MRYITDSIFIWWILLLETVRMFLIDELFVDVFFKGIWAADEAVKESDWCWDPQGRDGQFNQQKLFRG